MIKTKPIEVREWVDPVLSYRRVEYVSPFERVVFDEYNDNYPSVEITEEGVAFIEFIKRHLTLKVGLE